MENQFYTKLEAIQYLFDNSVYSNEWTGAGMWEAVQWVMNYNRKITKKMLDNKLKEASNF